MRKQLNTHYIFTLNMLEICNSSFLSVTGLGSFARFCRKYVAIDSIWFDRFSLKGQFCAFYGNLARKIYIIIIVRFVASRRKDFEKPLDTHCPRLSKLLSKQLISHALSELRRKSREVGRKLDPVRDSALSHDDEYLLTCTHSRVRESKNLIEV